MLWLKNIWGMRLCGARKFIQTRKTIYSIQFEREMLSLSSFKYYIFDRFEFLPYIPLSFCPYINLYCTCKMQLFWVQVSESMQPFVTIERTWIPSDIQTVTKKKTYTIKKSYFWKIFRDKFNIFFHNSWDKGWSF